MFGLLVWIWLSGWLEGGQLALFDTRLPKLYLQDLYPNRRQVWSSPGASRSLRHVKVFAENGRLEAFAVHDWEAYSDGLEQRHWLTIYQALPPMYSEHPDPLDSVENAAVREKMRPHASPVQAIYHFEDSVFSEFYDTVAPSSMPFVKKRSGYALRLKDGWQWFDEKASRVPAARFLPWF